MAHSAFGHRVSIDPEKLKVEAPAHRGGQHHTCSKFSVAINE